MRKKVVRKKITRKKITLYSLVVILMVGLASGCATTPEQPPYWPGDDWRISTPEEQGIDSALILAMLQEIQQKNLAIHSVLVIRHGYLVTEVYFPPYQQEIKHPVRSVTKTVTSALVGVAIQEGYIKSVTQNVLDFFPEIATQISGKTFQVTGNTVEGFFDSISFTFTDKNTYQSEMAWSEGQTLALRGSLNNVFYFNKIKDFESQQDLIFPAKGYWQDDHTFVEEFIPGLSSDLQVITQKYTFEGEKVTIDANSSLDLFSVHTTGEMVE